MEKHEPQEGWEEDWVPIPVIAEQSGIPSYNLYNYVKAKKIPTKVIKLPHANVKHIHPSDYFRIWENTPIARSRAIREEYVHFRNCGWSHERSIRHLAQLYDRTYNQVSENLKKHNVVENWRATGTSIPA